MTTTHVVTVHHRTPKFLEVQIPFIEKYVPRPRKFYLDVNFKLPPGLRAAELRPKFDDDVVVRFTRNLTVHHHVKLNGLNNYVKSILADGDRILFLDGDAWPVTDLAPWIQGNWLEKYPMIAIRRDELGDKLPHPSFTLVDGVWWRDSRGTWNINRFMKYWTRVLRKGLEWYPLVRTRGTKLHPVFFSCYGILNALGPGDIELPLDLDTKFNSAFDHTHIAYHHGAGFRRPWLMNVDCAKSKHEVEKLVQRNARLGAKVLENIKEGRGFWDGLE